MKSSLLTRILKETKDPPPSPLPPLQSRVQPHIPEEKLGKGIRKTRKKKEKNKWGNRHSKGRRKGRKEASKVDI